MNIFDLSSATIRTDPNINFNTFYYSTADLAEYSGAALTPGQNTLDLLFQESWSAVPLLSLGRLGPVESFHVLIEMSADNSAGETWTLHLAPLFSVDQEFPSDGQVNLDQKMVGADVAGGNFKVLTRTHPLSTATTTTLMYARTNATSTIIAGGGSEATIPAPLKAMLTTPFMGIHIENTGATTTFTIQTLEVWGTLRG